MKKKIIIAVILIILVALIFLGFQVFKTASEGLVVDEEFLGEEDFNPEDWEEEITGEGTITSFNVENLDTSLWTKTDKVLVNNEDMITAGQEILNVSNEDATGKIYSTISGKIYIEDSRFGKRYTIYDLDNLGYELQVPETRINDLKIGQKVETRLNASNEIIYGRICYISQIPQEEQIKIKVKLENSDKIKIGYTVRARVLLEDEIDANTPVYDIRNSIPKIGKTTINYKTSGEEVSFSSIEEMLADSDIITMYESALEEQGIVIEELMAQIQSLTDNMEIPEEPAEDIPEMDIEAVSEYWSGYWKEYWEAEYNKLVEEMKNTENPEIVEGEE
ncbi:MAG: HlyD family secretion protein [Clostridia bacterium]|nr:HlyD family secretion protein [Clostridia bacterium]